MNQVEHPVMRWIIAAGHSAIQQFISICSLEWADWLNCECWRPLRPFAAFERAGELNKAKEDSPANSNHSIQSNSPKRESCLMDEWIELEWNCFLSLPWAGWAKPSIEFHSMNGRNGLWLRSPASQGRGRESMEWKNWFVSEVNVVEWKQRRKWNLMKSNGMNFCCAMERSEWNAAPSSPQLRGKPSQSTNQSLFMKANWWLLARSGLLFFL